MRSSIQLSWAPEPRLRGSSVDCMVLFPRRLPTRRLPTRRYQPRPRLLTQSVQIRPDQTVSKYCLASFRYMRTARVPVTYRSCKQFEVDPIGGLGGIGCCLLGGAGQIPHAVAVPLGDAEVPGLGQTIDALPMRAWRYRGGRLVS